MSGRVVTFGEVMLRLSPPGFLRLAQAHALELTYGGSEANVAVSLASLGVPVDHVTRLPDNELGRAFNIGSADVLPIRELVDQVISRVGSASKVRSIPEPLARLAVGLLRPFGKAPLEPEHLAIAVADYVFDITRARQVLGWTPRWSNLEAMLDTYRALWP